MYKRFTFDELCQINSNFFKNLKWIYSSRGHIYFKEFLKKVEEEWSSIYFFESNDISFRIIKTPDYTTLVDEKDKIEMVCTDEEINKIHNLLKNDKKVAQIKKDNKSILQDLIDDFMGWAYQNIDGKPYLVYDIETIWNVNDLKNMRFMLWYSLISNDDHIKSIKYRFVWESTIKKFVDFMLDFEGYIVGFNNIYFDNPVVAYNSWYWDDEIKKLNGKSLDIFLFIRNLTGKRYSLEKVSTALISLWKTLASWQEWEEYLKQYLKTWDETLFNKVKSYCKNDVKMTLWVLLYLLKNKKVYIDGEESEFSLDQMVELGCKERSKEKKEEWRDLGMFW